MKIRTFQKGDEKRCSEITYFCFDIAKKLNKKDELFLRNFYTLEKISQLPKKSSFFVVESNKKIIGMGRLEKSKIATIYFDPKFHLKGGGTLIIKHLENLAKKNKLKKVYLDSLLQSTKFYKKNGYKILRRMKRPVNAMRMEKYLG